MHLDSDENISHEHETTSGEEDEANRPSEETEAAAVEEGDQRSPGPPIGRQARHGPDV